MKITVKNPIDNSDVEVEMSINTNLSTFDNGNVTLSVYGIGEIVINQAIVDEVSPDETVIES
jgi:hypothetical protein